MRFLLLWLIHVESVLQKWNDFSVIRSNETIATKYFLYYIPGLWGVSSWYFDTDTLQGLAASGTPVEIPYPYEYGTDPNVYVQKIEQNVIDVDQTAAGLISGMTKVVNGEIGQLYSRISYDYLIRSSYTDQWV